MSPVLFNIYMDEFHKIINHLMQVDNTCIIALSCSALQELLDICANFLLLILLPLFEKQNCLYSLNGLFVHTHYF